MRRAHICVEHTFRLDSSLVSRKQHTATVSHSFALGDMVALRKGTKTPFMVSWRALQPPCSSRFGDYLWRRFNPAPARTEHPFAHT